jgi:plasmid maintenance system killer protein
MRSYRDRKGERFAEGGRVPAFEGSRHQAEKRLRVRVLEAAGVLRDLAQLPSKRLEVLSGDCMNLQKTYELDLARQLLGKALSHLPQRPAAATLDSQRA